MLGVLTPGSVKRVSAGTAPQSSVSWPASGFRTTHPAAVSGAVGRAEFGATRSKECRRICIRGKHVARRCMRTECMFEGHLPAQGWLYARRNLSSQRPCRGASFKVHRLNAMDNQHSGSGSENNDEPESGDRRRRTPRKFPPRRGTNNPSPWDWIKNMFNPGEVMLLLKICHFES